MIIMLQKGLQQIKARLEQGGHKVVYSGEYNYPVDAFIYSSHQGGEFAAAIPPLDFGANSVISAENSVLGGHGAMLEINAAGKSFEEIEEMLLRKRRADFF